MFPDFKGRRMEEVGGFGVEVSAGGSNCERTGAGVGARDDGELLAAPDREISVHWCREWARVAFHALMPPGRFITCGIRKK